MISYFILILFIIFFNQWCETFDNGKYNNNNNIECINLKENFNTFDKNDTKNQQLNNINMNNNNQQLHTDNNNQQLYIDNIQKLSINNNKEESLIYPNLLILQSYNNLNSLNNYHHFTSSTNDNINCCLVKKEFKPPLDNENSLGKFGYKYIPLKNEKCNFNTLTSNQEDLFIENINGWTNNKCNTIESDLGSCSHNNNKECIDYIDKKTCDKYKDMIWNNKTCNG